MLAKGVNNVRGGDITTTSNLVAHFNRIFTKDEWEFMVVILVLDCVVMFQALFYYVR